MADVKSRTEDWKTLPWRDIQRNVFRLQQRIYRAERRGDYTAIATTKFTANGADDNSPRTEEPRDAKVSSAVLEWRRGGRPPRRP